MGVVVFQGLVNGLLLGTNYALMGIGFSLVFGVLGIVNFAHGAFVVMTMYIGLVLFNVFNIDPIAGAFIVTPVMFIFSMLIYVTLVGRYRSRISEGTMMLLTLGIQLAIESIIVFVFGTDILSIDTSYSTSAFNLFGARINIARLMGGALSIASIAALTLFLQRTTLGKTIRAAANDAEGAMLVGIKVEKIYLVAFGISVACAAISGSAMSTFSVMTPYEGVNFMLYAFIVAVLGTLGNIPGALVSGLTVGLLSTFTTLWLGARWTEAVVFGLLVLMLIFRPGGLLQSRSA